MKFNKKLAVAVSGAVLLLAGQNALADSATDIVDALVSKGVLTEEEGRLITKGHTSKTNVTPVLKEKDNNFTIESPNGNNSISLTGRIHFDYRGYGDSDGDSNGDSSAASAQWHGRGRWAQQRTELGRCQDELVIGANCGREHLARDRRDRRELAGAAAELCAAAQIGVHVRALRCAEGPQLCDGFIVVEPKHRANRRHLARREQELADDQKRVVHFG